MPRQPVERLVFRPWGARGCCQRPLFARRASDRPTTCRLSLSTGGPTNGPARNRLCRRRTRNASLLLRTTATTTIAPIVLLQRAPVARPPTGSHLAAPMQMATPFNRSFWLLLNLPRPRTNWLEPRAGRSFATAARSSLEPTSGPGRLLARPAGAECLISAPPVDYLAPVGSPEGGLERDSNQSQAQSLTGPASWRLSGIQCERRLSLPHLLLARPARSGARPAAGSESADLRWRPAPPGRPTKSGHLLIQPAH